MAHHDAAWLRDRVDGGASVRVIAAELNVTERTVRNRLRRAGIALPSEVKAAKIDLEAVFDEYKVGTSCASPNATASRRRGLAGRISEHGIERDVPVKRKAPPPRYPELDDSLWLLERLAEGLSVYRVARALQTGRRTVTDALRRHGLTWPPADADPVERLAYVNDPKIRRAAAQRIVDEATALAKRARAVRDGPALPT